MSQKPGKVQAPPIYKKLLVAYDGSQNSERALLRAISIAERSTASLKIVMVINPTLPVFSPYSPTLPPDAYDEITKAGKQTLVKAVERAKKTLTDVTGDLLEGQAGEAILKAAEGWDADAIVVGRRGLSAVGRFLLGGVSSAVVNNSKCDVLVVK